MVRRRLSPRSEQLLAPPRKFLSDLSPSASCGSSRSRSPPRTTARPRPPESPSTTTRIAALEAEIAALDARVRTANQARDAARTHLAKARERARETSAAIKAASAECEPLYARVNELNAMERKVRDAKRAVGFDSEAAVEAALAARSRG